MKVKKFKPDIKISVLVIFIISVLVTGIMFYLSPGSLRTFLELAKQNPLVLLLNYLPVILVMLFLYFVCGNFLFSAGLPSIVFIGAAFINRTKANLRQDPLVPSDVSLVTEAGKILENFDKTYTYVSALFIIIAILLCILAFVFIKRSDKLTIKKRITGAIVSAVCFGTLFTTAYSSTSLYDSFAVDGNIYFKVNQYISKGFLYSFLYDINNLKVTKPDGYNAKTYEEADKPINAENFEDRVKPNIVIVMNESYSDLSESDLISFAPGEDPMQNFKDIASQDDVVSGHIVVPNFGGGTADTEFDVVTGCSTKHIQSSQVSFNFVRQKMNTAPRLFKQIGYDTLAIHPGYGWFYNRLNVYDNMGYDDFQYLEEDFDPYTQSKGGYISEVATTESIINNFDKHMEESDNPFFEFCVTIQNHGPYERKYGDNGLDFDTDVELTQHERDIYSGYFRGIKDADEQIKELTDHFNECDEPVIFVFFGDHLPGFTNGTTYFSQFRPDIDLNGDIEHQLKSYETPFIIWANDAAKEETNYLENINSLELPDNNIISSFYLGAMALELVDMDDISTLYQYVNTMRRYIPVASDGRFMYPDGTYTTEVNDEVADMINYYKGWNYYKLFDEKVN